jgi:hypothetical protein
MTQHKDASFEGMHEGQYPAARKEMYRYGRKQHGYPE